MAKRRRSAVLFLLFVLFLTESPIYAKSPEASFREGVMAADREDWAAVERAMLRAIQKDSQESLRRVAIVGMRYESYLPYVYLGLARYRRRDLEGARRAWIQSVQQGAVQGWRDSSAFNAWWAEVLKRTGPLPPSPPPPEPRGERLASRLIRVEKALEQLGPPSSPNLLVLIHALETKQEARRAQEERAGSSEAMAEQAKRLQSLLNELESFARKRARKPQEVIDDLQKLVDRLKDPPNTLSPEARERLLEVELQLARNKPDLAILKQQESALLCWMFPLLEQHDAC